MNPSDKRVWLGLGSNVDAERNIRSAVKVLRKLFGSLTLSPVYKSKAVGFEGEDFLNLVVGIFTQESLDALQLTLKEIEAEHQRTREAEKFSPRTLDIDVLTFGDADLTERGINIPRHEILTYAFVLKPLADVAGEELHPHLQLSYQRLWDNFDQSSQAMQLYELNL